MSLLLPSRIFAHKMILCISLHKRWNLHLILCFFKEHIPFVQNCSLIPNIISNMGSFVLCLLHMDTESLLILGWPRILLSPPPGRVLSRMTCCATMHGHVGDNYLTHSDDCHV